MNEYDVCDGEPHCRDASDENQDACAWKTGRSQGTNSGKLVPFVYIKLLLCLESVNGTKGNKEE